MSLLFFLRTADIFFLRIFSLSLWERGG